MSEQPISESTLKYRVRVSIIRYLETASSADAQRTYEKGLRDVGAPGNVPNEMINQWENLVRIDDRDWYCAPEFSQAETEAIVQFHCVWDEVADATPEPMPDSIDDLIGTQEWNRFQTAAQNALKVFEARGLLTDRARF